MSPAMNDSQRAIAPVRGADGCTRVCVDAMGADFEPGLAAEAAQRAAASDPELEIELIGDAELLKRVPRSPRELAPRISVIDCARAVPMNASASEAIRGGRGTSMARGLERVAEGAADALVSAGNTGALMALARARLGMLPGVERPALMTRFPVRGGSAWVLDLGANLHVDAERLSEFALLGSAAVGALLGRAPRVALLNIGREPGKGPDVVREAARRCAVAELDFIGFIEGHDVFAGLADVVVCDGFAGNVLLKSSEGAIGMLLDQVDRSAAGWLTSPGLRRLRSQLHERYDPAGHNGASLLGIGGIVIKSHAHASIAGMAHAIGVAAQEVRRRMLPELERALWACG